MTVMCLVTGMVFTTLIKCEHPIHFKAWQVRGISKRMLEHEPEFRAAFYLLLEWLKFVGSVEGEVVLFLAHNAPFDLRVMRKALAKENIPFPVHWMFHDTIKIVKEYRPHLPSYALGKLADTLQCINKPIPANSFFFFLFLFLVFLLFFFPLPTSPLLFSTRHGPQNTSHRPLHNHIASFPKTSKMTE